MPEQGTRHNTKMTQTQSVPQMPSVIPFLKWAGGKRWLASRIINLIPHDHSRYLEPFLGSGAVYFTLGPRRAVLSDVNSELIETYQTIKSDWVKVQEELALHHRRHSKEYYYRMREMKPRTAHTKAARFIYLNRTCWNGLYRVNLKGKFNVPIGTKTNVLLESDNFEVTSNALQSAEIRCADFEATIDSATKGDVIFADPPYTVHHNHNGFIKYNEQIFSWEDQVRLHESLQRAIGRGAKVILTNANHESVRNLYKHEFELQAMSRKSVIAGSTQARKSYEELLITSF
jgi:DNA adenine methylase